jgi:hypothetical protein
MNEPDFERLLRSMARQSDDRPLPDAASIWSAAAVHRQLEARRNAGRFIRIAELAAMTVSGAGAILLFPTQLFAGLDPEILKLFGILLGAAVTLTGAVFGWFWAEE